MLKTSFQRAISIALYGVVGLLGLKYGYDAGVQMSGTLLGVVMGLNAAVFCALMAAAALSFLSRLFGKRPTQP
jgi:hypothetical protein